MKRILIMGGGTFYDVRPHLSLCAKAFGNTAKTLFNICESCSVPAKLVLTKMAHSDSPLCTNADVAEFLEDALEDPTIGAIIFNIAMCDFQGSIVDAPAGRLTSKEHHLMALQPDAIKVISKISQRRPDIYAVGFKTAFNNSLRTGISKGTTLMHESNLDAVLVNDIGTRTNTLLTRTGISHTDTRDTLLQLLVTEAAKGIKCGETANKNFEAFKCFQ